MMSFDDIADIEAAEPNLPVAAKPNPVALTADALSFSEKAAVILVALGPEAAGMMLSQMDDDLVRRFARAVADMRRVPHETVLDVVSEFLEVVSDTVSVIGGTGELRRYLSTMMDEEAIDRLLEDLEGGEESRSVWIRLGEAPEARLASWLQVEHPQFSSVVLSRLPAARAARVLEKLEDTYARDVVLRMSRTPHIQTDAQDAIVRAIERDFLSMVQRERGARKPAELIAGLMNHVAGPVREAMLGHLDEEMPALSQEVQRVMFTFADIADRVAPRDVSIMVKAVEEQTLMEALKSAQADENPAVDFILGNIPKRLSERLVDDLENLQPPSAKEGEAAQIEVVGVIREMARVGQIKLIEIEED